jgi:hypothetical protein
MARTGPVLEVVCAASCTGAKLIYLCDKKGNVWVQVANRNLRKIFVENHAS